MIVTPVVGLVAVAQALQDLDRVGHGGLVDGDLLEAALEGRVLLEVLAVLVERGGADGLQLAPGQHGLEDRGGVDGALGGTRTHQGVDLVDEQDDVAAGADLLEHLLQALLEVAPVAAAGHQRAEVERVTRRLPFSLSGTSLDTMFWARPSTMAVLPTPGSPTSTGLFLVRRTGPHTTLDLRARPITGSSFPAGELGEVATELVEHERAGRLGLGGAATGRGRPPSRRGPPEPW